MTFNILKSKTFWGAVLTAGSWLLAQQHIGLVEVGQAVGGLIGTIGLRDALTKPVA